jgi:hypothetical protein
LRIGVEAVMGLELDPRSSLSPPRWAARHQSTLALDGETACEAAVAATCSTGAKAATASSQKTVRNRFSNIFTKLQVLDRAQAIVKAREAGLGGG